MDGLNAPPQVTMASRPTLLWSKISWYGSAVLSYVRTPVIRNFSRTSLPCRLPYTYTVSPGSSVPIFASSPVTPA